MDEEVFNISLRKFLKTVDQAVDKAIKERRIAGTESFPVDATLEIPALGLKVRFDGEIKLQ